MAAAVTQLPQFVLPASCRSATPKTITHMKTSTSKEALGSAESTEIIPLDLAPARGVVSVSQLGSSDCMMK